MIYKIKIKKKSILLSFYNYLIFCYSCNIVIKLSRKIPSQAFLLYFPVYNQLIIYIYI